MYCEVSEEQQWSDYLGLPLWQVTLSLASICDLVVIKREGEQAD